MIQTLAIPSSYNVYNIICRRNQPLNSINAPYEFLSVDENGVETPVDITTESFRLLVYKNTEVVLDSTDLVIVDPNQLYINIASITLDEGVYNYEIMIVNDVSVIKGKFKVEDNGEQ